MITVPTFGVMGIWNKFFRIRIRILPTVECRSGSDPKQAESKLTDFCESHTRKDCSTIFKIFFNFLEENSTVVRTYIPVMNDDVLQFLEIKIA
jgi:hypothetical protein